MKSRLLKSTVSRFEPQAAPYDVWDDALPGLVLRVMPSGSRTFYVVYRLKGRRSRYRLGAWPNLTPDGAWKLAQQVTGEVAAGNDPNQRRKGERRETERAKVGTLKAFLDGRYAEWARGHIKSADFQIARVRADFADWLEKPMAELSPWLIEGYRKKRRDLGRSPKTINRELQRLRSIVAKAVAWGVLDAHPFATVKPLKADKSGRVRYLSEAEEAALRKSLVKREDALRAARDRFNEWRTVRHMKPLPRIVAPYVDHLRPMVLIAMNTGMRRGELLSLRWGDVDLGGKLLTVRGATAKTGQTRRIPLNAEALSVFKTWRGQAADSGSAAFVFPGDAGRRLGRVDRAWSTAAKLAEIEDFRFHDLRHHFASRLVQAGVPLNTVRELLGHSEIAMTMRYSHLAPDTLASAVEKLGEHR